jgi:hypothetical protein
LGGRSVAIPGRLHAGRSSSVGAAAMSWCE